MALSANYVQQVASVMKQMQFLSLTFSCGINFQMFHEQLQPDSTKKNCFDSEQKTYKCVFTAENSHIADDFLSPISRMLVMNTIFIELHVFFFVSGCEWVDTAASQYTDA